MMAINGQVYEDVSDPSLSYEGTIELPQSVQRECAEAIYEIEQIEARLLAKILKAVALMEDSSVFDVHLKKMAALKREIINRIFDRTRC